MSAGVAATCPSLDRLAKLCRLLPEPQRSAAIAEVEALREAHIRLRAAAAERPPGDREILEAVRRRADYEVRVVSLLEGVTTATVRRGGR